MVARPLSIVQVLPELESGGVERGTLEMGAFLASRGHSSLVISGGGQMVAELQRNGSQHLEWPYIGEKSPRCLKYIWPLRQLLQRRTVDILHLRSRLPAWIGYLAWRSLPAGRRPCLVTTFHGFYSVNAYSAIMTRGQKIIAVSRTIAEHIQSAYGIPADRIETIYRGFDERAFDPIKVAKPRIEALRRQWGVPPDVPVILMPGRMTRLKGHGLLLDSLSRLTALSWQAVCVGDTLSNPGLTAALERRCDQLGLSGRVSFPGLCTDMPAALLAADLVVAPSIKPESFGRTAVEAHAMGKPVIASAHGGSLETVRHGHTGWLFKPGDVGELAGALKAGLEDPVRSAQRGQNGLTWVRARFTTRQMCAATESVYQQLIAARTG